MNSKIIFVLLAMLFLFLSIDVVAHPASGIVLDRAGVGERMKYGIVILSASILCAGAIVRQRRRRQRV
jgi:hypothetical protein